MGERAGDNDGKPRRGGGRRRERKRGGGKKRRKRRKDSINRQPNVTPMSPIQDDDFVPLNQLIKGTATHRKRSKMTISFHLNQLKPLLRNVKGVDESLK